MAERVDLDELERLAKAATPGAWRALALGSEGYDICPAEGPIRERGKRIARCGYRAWDDDRSNAEYIAAANPITVLALIAELRRAPVANRPDLNPPMDKYGGALATYDQATGRPDPAAGHESGDTSASQLPPPPAGVRQDLDERERRKATAEFLRTERERYEYLLACAKDTEDEELAWETIVARVTVGDFIRAAKEVLAFRAAAGHAEPEGPR